MGASLALLTELDQLTMAYGYWKSRVREHEAVFHLYFREHPFGGGYAVACGLEQTVEWLRTLHFEEDDLTYLGSLLGTDEEPLFEARFLEQLSEFRFRGDVDAVPEGTVVFAGEPIVRVRGKLIQGQLVETALLTLINFPTLVATKASRICRAEQGDDVLEFGMPRAQGPDGALTASRAAYVGGCAATSNLLAGKRYGIPVGGTHAHSWVLDFGDEQPALGGVYKLTAAREPGGEWEFRAKATDDALKATPPGILQVRRTDEWSRYKGDIVYDEGLGLPRRAAPGHDLLVPVLRAGRLAYDFPPLDAVRERTQSELACFDPEVLALNGARPYPVTFERRLARLRRKLQEQGKIKH